MQVCYRGPGGRIAADPLALDVPMSVDVEALACLFTRPTLEGQFVPRPPWRGLERVRQRPTPALEPRPLVEVFQSALADLVDEVEVVGVELSGGLDSFAVLTHVLPLAVDRRVVAFTTALRDDDGRSSVEAARSLLQAFGKPVDLVVVDPDHDQSRVRWSPHGPRLDAMPGVRAGTVRLAADRGVGVLLNGSGADELLGVHRYLTGSLLRHCGPRAALRYLCDVASTGPGLAGEALALLAADAPRRLRAEMYWAVNHPEWQLPEVAAVLTEPMQGVARDWEYGWISEMLGEHVTAGHSWAAADAWDAMWPYDPIPPAGEIREASPFLHPRIVAAALALPRHSRYDSTLPTAYLRCKAQVVGLVPPRLWPALPRQKQYYARAISESCRQPLEAPRSVEIGLIDPARLAVETEVQVRLMVAAVEEWLEGVEALRAVSVSCDP